MKIIPKIQRVLNPRRFMIFNYTVRKQTVYIKYKMDCTEGVPGYHMDIIWTTYLSTYGDCAEMAARNC